MSKYRVHVITYGNPSHLIRQFDQKDVDGLDFELTIDRSAKVADFTFILGITEETKICSSREKTIFVLQEPPEIYPYSSEFLNQFSLVIGPRFGYSIKGNLLETHPALPWFVGIEFAPSHMTNYFGKLGRRFPVLTKKVPGSASLRQGLNEILNSVEEKNNTISIVTSSKALTPEHRRRLDFIEFLRNKNDLPLEFYGGKYGYLPNKWSALSKSTHHLALENSSWKNYWSEKLADPILALNRVYYSGAENISDYFDGESVLSLNLDDFDLAHEQIKTDFFAKPVNSLALDASRKKIIHNYSILNLIQETIETISKDGINLPTEWTMSSN